MTSNIPAKMKCLKIHQKHGPFVLEEADVPQPKHDEVLVRVEFCGVCGGDHVIQHGLLPQCSYPRVAGHEVVGSVVAVGPHAPRWKVGDRVGRGWCGGYCFECLACRKGDFIHCSAHLITGSNLDGGQAQYMLSPWNALAAVPVGMDGAVAAPLMCAGVTVFNSLRNVQAHAGDFVIVQGIGGLGHLAIQFANKMGYRVIVLSSSSSKKQQSVELGAEFYIDVSTQSAVQEVERITHGRGASIVVCTSPSAGSMASVVEALAPNGTMLVLGAGPDALTVHPAQLIRNQRIIRGWASGTPQDSEDTLNFAHSKGVRVIYELFPLEQANEVMKKLDSNQLRYRGVLQIKHE